ncbi:MAG: hypothetical protein V1674_06220 [Candidatus Omnitrophota bacterium]
MKKLIILVLFIGLTGCAIGFQSIDDRRLEGIMPGMSKEEVVKIIGAPVAEKIVTMEGKQYEAWKYPVKESAAGRFKPIASSYYRVLFLDGKVAQWDRIKTYAQPSYEFQKPDAPKEGVTTIGIFKTED